MLDCLVSYQDNAWSHFSGEMTVADCLSDIRSEKYIRQVLELRNFLKKGDNEMYDSHKKRLPAVTFCGVFDGERRKDKLKRYNGLIVLDIDKLDDEEILRVKRILQDDLFVFAYWESPSQKGIKGLVSLQYQFDLDHLKIDLIHKSAFRKLSNYFNTQHNIALDNSGSDTTRLCFFSYDPNLVLKNRIIPYEIGESEIIDISGQKDKKRFEKLVNLGQRDALFNPKDRNRPNDRYVMNTIMKFLEKRKLSITYSYDEWYKVAMAIANTFTYEIGEKYFLRLSSIDDTKYSEVNCKNFLRSCYERRSGAINFSTIIFLANQKGYFTMGQRERGAEADG